jgi:hypothetical protein
VEKLQRKILQNTSFLCFSSLEINTATAEEQTSNNRFPAKEEVTGRAGFVRNFP